MSNRFDYVKYDDEAMRKQETFKQMMLTLEANVEQHLQNGRAKALVLTKAEELYMWVGKAIRDEQVEKRKSELQEERANE